MIIDSHSFQLHDQDVYCTYKVFLDEEDTKTETISETSNPDFNHRKQFDFCPATKQLVDYLRDGCITITVWGRQMVKGGTASSVSHSHPTHQTTLRSHAGSKESGRLTKQTLQEDLMNQANNLMGGFKMNGRIVDPNKQSIIVELLLMKKQQARQQQRIVS